MLWIGLNIPSTLDPFHFAFWHNRFLDDTVTLTLHPALGHLKKKKTYVRMLFTALQSIHSWLCGKTEGVHSAPLINGSPFETVSNFRRLNRACSSWGGQNPGELLPLHRWEHPACMQHVMAGKYSYSGSQISTKDHPKSLKNHQHRSSPPVILLPLLLPEEGQVYHQGYHPTHTPFTLLPSGKYHWCITTHSTHFTDSFFTHLKS